MKVKVIGESTVVVLLDMSRKEKNMSASISAINRTSNQYFGISRPV
jgi:hypothetical protein